MSSESVKTLYYEHLKIVLITSYYDLGILLDITNEKEDKEDIQAMII